jgi:hypothetical protein
MVQVVSHVLEENVGSDDQQFQAHEKERKKRLGVIFYFLLYFKFFFFFNHRGFIGDVQASRTYVLYTASTKARLMKGREQTKIKEKNPRIDRW